MTDTWTDRLSEYIDDELDPEERRALEGHLTGCATCRETLAELNAVVVRGAALEDRPPGRNLWPALAARISGEHPKVVDLDARRRSRVSLSVPQLVAAGFALLLVGAGGAVWLADGPPPTVAEHVGAPGSAAVAVMPVASGEYDVAVAELETLLEQNRDRLDSVTVRIVEQNLAIIDRAIAEARAALAADPSDVYLNTHLAHTMRRKVELLRRVAELVEG